MQLNRRRLTDTVWVACLVLGMSTSPQGEEARVQRLPPGLMEHLQDVLLKADMIVSTDTSVEMEYHCQDYRIHSLEKGGSPRPRSRTQRGPTDDGYLLKLTWHDSGYEKENKGNASPTSEVVRTLTESEYYWFRHQTVYRLPNDDGYVRLEYRFGSNTDAKLLPDVHKELETVGKKVTFEFDAPDNDWDTQAAKLQDTLAKVVAKRQPEAQWRRDPNLLICEFKTQMYDIHAVDEIGHVSREPHQEVGPAREGFVIKLSPIQREVTPPIHPTNHRVAPLYWRHYTHVYVFAHCQLELLYNHHADKALLEDVDAALEKMGGKVSKF